MQAEAPNCGERLLEVDQEALNCSTEAPKCRKRLRIVEGGYWRWTEAPRGFRAGVYKPLAST